ncbi:MAG: tetratricopeptide repeat protein [Actinomycetota bacterium]
MARRPHDHFTDELVEYREHIASLVLDLGPDDPRTLTARGRLGRELSRNGRPAEAIEQLEAVLADRVRVLGIDHPDCFRTRGNIAESYCNLDDLQRAHDLYAALLADRTRVLGADDPETVMTRHNLATVGARIVEDAAAAQAILEEHVAEVSELYGETNRATFTARGHLAEHFIRVGNPARAVMLLTDLVADRAEFLGDDDRDTLRSRRMLAETLAKLDDADGARAILDEVVERLTATLGPGHADTLRARAERLAVDYRLGAADPGELTAFRADARSNLEFGHPLLEWFTDEPTSTRTNPFRSEGSN